MLEAIGFRNEVGRVEVTFRARTKVKRAKKPETEKTKEATMAGELRGPIKPTFRFGDWGLKRRKKKEVQVTIMRRLEIETVRRTESMVYNIPMA